MKCRNRAQSFVLFSQETREKTAGLPFVKKDRRKKFERKLVRKKRFETCVVAYKRLEIYNTNDDNNA